MCLRNEYHTPLLWRKWCKGPNVLARYSLAGIERQSFERVKMQLEAQSWQLGIGLRSTVGGSIEREISQDGFPKKSVSHSPGRTRPPLVWECRTALGSLLGTWGADNAWWHPAGGPVVVTKRDRESFRSSHPNFHQTRRIWFKIYNFSKHAIIRLIMSTS